MDKEGDLWPGLDKRYKSLGLNDSNIPTSESLKDVSVRALEFWHEKIVPRIKERKKVLIVSHSSTILSLLKVLDDIPEENIPGVAIPRSHPLLYRINVHTLKPLPMETKRFGILNGTFIGDSLELEKAM